MQELEAIGLDWARTEVSVQYVDHNLLQTDEKRRRPRVSTHRLPAIRPTNRETGVASDPYAAVRSRQDDRAFLDHTLLQPARSPCLRSVGGLEVALAISGRPLNISDARGMGCPARG